jgi:hypothetical protein
LARARGDVARGGATVLCRPSAPPPNVAAAAIATAAEAAIAATTTVAMIRAYRIANDTTADSPIHHARQPEPRARVERLRATEQAYMARYIARCRLAIKPYAPVDPSRERRRRMSDLEAEMKDLLSGHRLSHDQIQALQHGESDADTVRSLQRMLANTQNAILRLAREIDELRPR